MPSFSKKKFMQSFTSFAYLKNDFVENRKRELLSGLFKVNFKFLSSRKKPTKHSKSKKQYIYKEKTTIRKVC